MAEQNVPRCSSDDEKIANNVPRCSSDDEKIAVYLLKCARNFCDPPCRITVKHLKVHEWYHSSIVWLILVFCSLILLLLPFSENLHSFTLSFDVEIDEIGRYFVPSVVLEGVALLVFSSSLLVRCYLMCLCNSSLSSARKLYYYKHELRMIIFYIMAIAISWVLWITSTAIYISKGYYSQNDLMWLYFRQLIRPLFLIWHVQLMRKTIKAVARSFIPIVRIFILLACVIFLFAVIGVVLFRNINDEYFNSIINAQWSLLVYLSTSNSPDILTTIYEENRLSFLYFAFFFLISNYFIFDVILALLAAIFVSSFKKSTERCYKSRLINIKLAFKWLVREGKVNKDSFKNVIKKVDPNFLDVHQVENISIQWDDFLSMCEKLFEPNLKNGAGMNNCWYEFALNLKRVIIYTFGVISFLDAIVITALIAVGSNHGLVISGLCFSVLFATEIILRMTVLPVCYYFIHTSDELQCRVLFLRLWRRNSQAGESLPLINQSNQSSKSVQSRDQKKKSESPSRLTECLNKLALLRKHPKQITGIILYVIDMVVLLFCIVVGFWYAPCLSHDDLKSCLFSNCSIFSSDGELVFLPCTGVDLYQIVSILVFLRFMLIAIRSIFISDVIHTFLHGVILLTPLILIAYVMFYFFAVTGIFISYTYDVNLFNATVTNISECGTYEQLHYHSFNFKDFASALVTLWNLMLVNNWFVFVRAYVDATTAGFEMYFVVWWVLIETILKGMLLGILLHIIGEAFDKSFDEQQEERNGTNQGSECPKNMKKFLYRLGVVNKGNKQIGFNSLLNTWRIYEIESLRKKLSTLEEELENRAKELAKSKDKDKNKHKDKDIYYHPDEPN